MTTIAKLAVQLIADAAGFISTMDQAESKTQTWSQAVSKNIMSVGSSITSLGQTSTTFLTLPLVAAGAAAFTMAADMQDALGATEQIYGDSSDTVKNWVSNLETYYGIAQNEALQYASMMGSMLQNIGGLSKAEAADQASSLIELAGDLTAMYGGTTADAVRALTGALKGNNTMLDNYGMVATDAMIQTKALELGLSDGTSELSAAARQAATLALIMEQAAAAQGQAAREADGASGSLRAQTTELKNLAISIGTMLLPVGIQLLGWAKDILGWFQKLNPEQQKWILIILGIVAVAGPLLIIIGSLVTAIGAIVGVVGAVTFPMLLLAAAIIGLAAYIAFLYYAWTNNWGGIQEKTASVIAFIQGIIQSGLQFIENLTSGKLGAVSTIFNNTFAFIRTYIENFVSMWKSIFAAFAAAARGDWYAFGEHMRAAFDTGLRTIAALIQTSWSNIQTAISTLVRNVINFFNNTDWGQVGRNISQGIANGIHAGLSWIVSAARNAANAALQAAKGFLDMRSPSKVFEMQVGWQMAAGTALGWERGIDKMLPSTMPGLQPAAVGGMPGLNTSGGGVRGNVFVTVQHNPTVSLGDRHEVQRVFKPILQDLLRDLGVEVNK